jgi:hypothetical protein
MTADSNSSATVASRPKFWKTILLLAGSAAFGGVTLALWNRRDLARIREQGNVPARDEKPSSEDDIF